MSIALITGSGGLIGGESVEFFSSKFTNIVGIDNDLRSSFFGNQASTKWNVTRLENNFKNFKNYNIDIRNYNKISKIFNKFNTEIKLIIHTAAQPSHDWAAKDPFTDFSINANGTLVLLENYKKYCPNAVFIHCSTNKVYGDTPNFLPLIERKTRWEIQKNHKYFKNGIDETMTIDQSKHSLFGASKLAADILVQEYGKYFNLKTGTFRGGCLTGPLHSGTELHGFLSYLIKCAVEDKTYNIFGYKGKQVRDNIHSFDFVNMLWNFYRNPKIGEVYNIGGSRYSNCSIIEAIKIVEEISGKKMKLNYLKENRIGDHVWYISSVEKFKKQYKNWNFKYNTKDIIVEIYNKMINDKKKKLFKKQAV
jgi:CDP-paratose 2-epimerase